MTSQDWAILTPAIVALLGALAAWLKAITASQDAKAAVSHANATSNLVAYHIKENSMDMGPTLMGFASQQPPAPVETPVETAPEVTPVVASPPVTIPDPEPPMRSVHEIVNEVYNLLDELRLYL